MKAFFIAVLGHNFDDQNDITPGILGVTKGYYGVVEAQGRGSLHCHMLLWLEGGLNPSEISARLLKEPDGEFEQRLIFYLDSMITTAIPSDPGDVPDVPSSSVNPCSVRPIFPTSDEETESYSRRCQKDLFNLAKQCQIHSHNAGCYKNWRGPPEPKTCRFNLDESKLNNETYIDRSTGEIHGRCLDGMVNQFNDQMLEILRCNMDIKFIGSGNTAHAVLLILEIALQRLNTYDPDANTDQVRAKKLLVKCANAIISAQELSAQQVSSYLLGHGDCYTSHLFKQIYWRSYDGFVKRTSRTTFVSVV
ncbi:hypothetical protein F5887DRAFT_1060863 [Amanita rubescens]|nr:hypothetical protein F5887DRAFT_1060863 [Amanita rubescens]